MHYETWRNAYSVTLTYIKNFIFLSHTHTHVEQATHQHLGLMHPVHPSPQLVEHVFHAIGYLLIYPTHAPNPIYHVVHLLPVCVLVVIAGHRILPVVS